MAEIESSEKIFNACYAKKLSWPYSIQMVLILLFIMRNLYTLSSLGLVVWLILKLLAIVV